MSAKAINGELIVTDYDDSDNMRVYDRQNSEAPIGFFSNADNRSINVRVTADDAREIIAYMQKVLEGWPKVNVANAHSVPEPKYSDSAIIERLVTVRSTLDILADYSHTVELLDYILTGTTGNCDA